MKTSGKTILITGGATGIGLALAEAFLERQCEALICGRRERALAAARAKHPALHSFSLSLRHQLTRTSVRVFEIIPPTDVALAAIRGIEEDRYEIAVAAAQGLVAASRGSFEQVFVRMNGG